MKNNVFETIHFTPEILAVVFLTSDGLKQKKASKSGFKSRISSPCLLPIHMYIYEVKDPKHL
jgi:hypothetical protein